VEVRHFNTYLDAISAALKWLKDKGVVTLNEAFEARRGGFGMRTIGGGAGYRIEFDPTHGAHINVWYHKTKGPHYIFKGNQQDVRAKWRQLYWWDPNLIRRNNGA
jgi:hypothetical protein